MDRTIIDILNKGNQELFHSSMIAWLLDPTAEHQLGDNFLKSFATLVAENPVAKRDDRMLNAVQNHREVTVSTETPGRGSRYDIELNIGRLRVIIENKTKSLGGHPQFEKYDTDDVCLVALGLTDVCFDSVVKSEYPLVLYSDICIILQELKLDTANNFHVLIHEYLKYLSREVRSLELTNKWTDTGDVEYINLLKNNMLKAVATENDKRFLNFLVLHRLLNALREDAIWSDTIFNVDKNSRSGVWLKCHRLDKLRGYRYRDNIAEFCNQCEALVWLHIELWDGIFASSADTSAGTIQLKCQSSNSNKEAAASFKDAWGLTGDEYFSKSPQESWKSFYLIGNALRLSDLTVSGLQARLNEFMERFCDIR